MNTTSRKRVGALLAVLLLVGLWAVPASAGPPAPDSPEFGGWVMRKLDDQYRGDQSHAWMKMKVKTEHWSRTMAKEAWSRGTDYSLVRILRPRKEKGTATLKANSDLFTYLNKTGRTIKITSGMMGGSWMGSHFTNDDLIRHSRLSRDYHIKKLRDGNRDGVAVYQFQLTPKPNAPVVWGKLVITVRKADLELRGEQHIVYLIDVGLLGVFVEWSGTLPIGEPVTVRFHLPGNEHAVEATARVAWCNSAGEDARTSRLPSGMGLAFDQISDGDRERIRQRVLDHCRGDLSARRFHPAWPEQWGEESAPPASPGGGVQS